MARIRKQDKDLRSIEPGKWLEGLRARHEAGLILSVEFLKAIIVLAREARAAEEEVVPEEEEYRSCAALTELLEGVRNESASAIVESVVNNVDDVVCGVWLEGWRQAPRASRKRRRR